jgi:DNA (cytosine-5)-methyltransferase 1
VDQLRPVRTGHLFAGAGGGILAALLRGERPVFAVEIDPYCREVLLARQRDRILPWFPIWDDVRTFDGRAWRGLVDVLEGGFPCQDISCAGKGAGLEGERSGLWSEMARVIGEIKPRWALVENSPMLTGRGLDRVLMDLATLGYNARWGVLGADDAGAPHIRKRIWILAHTRGQGSFPGPQAGIHRVQESAGVRDEQSERCRRDVGNFMHTSGHANGAGLALGAGERIDPRPERPPPERAGNPLGATPWDDGEPITGADGTTRLIKPGLSPLAYGVARRVDKIRATGNGQVPAVAALAWDLLAEGL